MAERQVIKLGFYMPSKILSRGLSKKTFRDYTSDKTNIHGRTLLALTDYLENYSKTFVKPYYQVTSELNAVFSNGTLKGLIGHMNRSQIDIAVPQAIMNELKLKFVDFAYPYKLQPATFMTQMPQYKPEVLGILKTFSWQLWVTILLILIVMSLVYYTILKNKNSFKKVSLHTFAVLLRQSSILRPSTTVERLLVYSWVIGAMFICLSYDSVFLSFLAFPPINPIKDVSQLAKAVTNGEFHCVTPRQSGYHNLLAASKQESLSIIGKDMNTNKLNNDQIWIDFFNGNINQNLAFIVDADIIDVLSVGNKFVSEDRFLEVMAALMIRKGFCCKTVISSFVHKMMASGLHSKYLSDKSFLLRLPLFLKYQEKDTSKRKLNLTDVAPAFIVLITGYVVSFIVFMGEILSNPGKK